MKLSSEVHAGGVWHGGAPPLLPLVCSQASWSDSPSTRWSLIGRRERTENELAEDSNSPL